MVVKATPNRNLDSRLPGLQLRAQPMDEAAVFLEGEEWEQELGEGERSPETLAGV